MTLSTVFIDPSAYTANLQRLRRLWGTAVRLCAVVKADAYGHGLKTLAPLAEAAGASYLGITENDEARWIRQRGISLPLLRLRPALEEEAAAAVPLGVEEIVGSYDTVKRLSRVAQNLSTTLPIHIKIDSGIGRMGFHLPEQYEALRQALSLPHIHVVGIMTHYPSGDEETELTRQQEKHFWSALQTLNVDLNKVIVHASNSVASLALPQQPHTMVRAGIVSYGLRPSPAFPLPEGFAPVMTWQTRVVLIRQVPAGSTIGYGMTHTTARPSLIATLPVGYANGYVRTLSNRAEVLIQGKRCPVVGRISMNMTTVDVSDLERVHVGDEAVLVGRQGDQIITLDELAQHADTISYELACRVGTSSANSRQIKYG